eukprot:CAMPEP_0197695086 /NCGR_PEP_ID=MMETSP1338-20131121/114741_1 /TAXON_ID=43686 ORGANISM="Pelagodinium beii, Strain RCC1491" /NCGR_SAMPLE_ID=MMETSP1338 /ASSEMBLY_ACC=CAM_ASM_000754 /LENGTH=46 /DNA_ID= /DNA_START= /DNA_END= /DNA_ORIENTATION=
MSERPKKDPGGESGGIPLTGGFSSGGAYHKEPAPSAGTVPCVPEIR